MGANVEMDVFLTKECPISLHAIFSLFEKKGLYVKVQSILVADDWTYKNERTIDEESIENFVHDVCLEPITLVQCVVNRLWDCTLIVSQLEGEPNNISFGASARYFQAPAGYDGGDIMLFWYDVITDFIDEICWQEPLGACFLAASLGIEYSVSFEGDLVSMLNDDNGADRWILPKLVGRDIVLEAFAKEEKSHIMVFTRKHRVPLEKWIN